LGLIKTQIKNIEQIDKRNSGGAGSRGILAQCSLALENPVYQDLEPNYHFHPHGKTGAGFKG
jgi:hypothetical protein